MTWWRENFNRRFGYKLPTGLDTAGQPTYGALQMADCAHEKTSQLESGVDGESERITDVFQTEAPLVIRPYIGSMTQSEIMAVMVGGFATPRSGDPARTRATTAPRFTSAGSTRPRTWKT